MNAGPQFRHDAAEGEAVHEVPASVRKAAAQAQAWISEGLAGDGFTQQGRVRAAQLAQEPRVSLAVLKEIRSFLARHLAQKPADTRKPNGDPTPWLLAVQAWGGDDALPWAERLVEQAERGDEAGGQEVRWGQAELRTDEAASYLSPKERALLRPPARLPDGAWRLDAILARGGEVKSYTWGQEQTPWEELRADAVLSSLVGAPVTYSPHPKEVTPANAAEVTIPGARVLAVRLDEDARLLLGTLVVPQMPSQRGVSVGWKMGRLDTSTSPPSQRALRANHLTLTDHPRVKGAGLRLDAQAQEKTVKRTIHGVEFDLDDKAAQALDAERAAQTTRQDEASASAKQATEKLKDAEAKLQEADGKIKALEAARLDEAQIQARVKARAALETRAREVLPQADHARLDSMSDADIKRAALKAAYPNLDASRLDGPALDGAWSVLGAQAPKDAKPSTAGEAATLDSRTPAPRQDERPRALDAHFNNPPKAA